MKLANLAELSNFYFTSRKHVKLPHFYKSSQKKFYSYFFERLGRNFSNTFFINKACSSVSSLPLVIKFSLTHFFAFQIDKENFFKNISN